MIRSSGRSSCSLPDLKPRTPFATPNSHGSVSQPSPGSEICGRDFAMSRAASTRCRCSLSNDHKISFLLFSASALRAATARRRRAAETANLRISFALSVLQRRRRLFQMSQRPCCGRSATDHRKEPLSVRHCRCPSTRIASAFACSYGSSLTPGAAHPETCEPLPSSRSCAGHKPRSIHSQTRREENHAPAHWPSLDRCCASQLSSSGDPNSNLT